MIKKQNLRKFAGIVLLSCAIAAGSGIVYESSVNHDIEYCLLNNIFGLRHQAERINEGTNGFRYQAVYIPSGVDEKDFFDKEKLEFNNGVYAGCYGQHVVEFVKYNGANNYSPIDNNNVLAVSDGFLVDRKVYGERVEVYDHNGVSPEPQLIRVFKK